MSGDGWTVEGPFVTYRDGRQQWCVMDRDGERIEWFESEERAEEWLDLQRAAAEVGEDE